MFSNRTWISESSIQFMNSNLQCSLATDFSLWVCQGLYIGYGTLLTFQRFQILLPPKMFPVWDFVVGIFAQKAMLKIAGYSQSSVVSIYVVYK